MLCNPVVMKWSEHFKTNQNFNIIFWHSCTFFSTFNQIKNDLFNQNYFHDFSWLILTESKISPAAPFLSTSLRELITCESIPYLVKEQVQARKCSFFDHLLRLFTSSHESYCIVTKQMACLSVSLTCVFYISYFF